ncbi:GntR family transcriptional regulator [Paenibacillus nasutitermitis]|uniref:GntR family transcriptional regulator n=1 Tax=Paenibacillus nasutitermitis TaxID=1652958 RepID=A0A916YKI8_9BACL|nr:GntR family transcriptional regulator [Paenibacillus nasutitermitis]
MELRIAYDRYYTELGKKSEALYQALREAIVAETLPEGFRLPSSRKLAKLYELSRGAVNIAYDTLLAEGYVRTETGSGTFIAYRPSSAEDHAKAEEQGRQHAIIHLSDWAERLDGSTGNSMGITKRQETEERESGNWDKSAEQAESGGPASASRSDRPLIDFGIGQVDPELFPVEEWRASLYAEVRAMTSHWPLPPAEVEGYLPLREALLQELRRERGIHASASQLFLTSGSAQAITLLSMLLVTPGTSVVLEDPCYSGTARAVRAAGGTIIPARVDDQGILLSNWPAKLLFVTPTRHFPSGAVLSADRRKALLDWAVRRQAVIIEDDYDSELRWGGRPSEPLKALDREGRVVYVGTFSKTMFSDLRIGYVVVPESLVEPFRLAKSLIEPRPAGLAEQRALANFMNSGSYARHLRRMKRVCGRRLICLREQMSLRLGRWLRIVPVDAGLHLYAQWRGEAGDYERFREGCAAAGVHFTDDGGLWLNEPEVRAGLFGFAHLSEELLDLGVRRMEQVVRLL